jgi:hypothetical protein
VELTFGLTGRVPDGMVFRVSSIDVDQSRAHQLQGQFVNQLLSVLPAAERRRLSGLGEL